jgi:hypothetical protein
LLERVTATIAELEVVQAQEKVTTAKRVADLVRGDVAQLVMAMVNRE